MALSDELGVLAGQQAALRRVATLVARGATPSEVFSAVADELARCLDAHHAILYRYEPGGVAVMLAAHGGMLQRWTGVRFSLEGDSASALVFRTGRTARMDSYENAQGSAAAQFREWGVRGAVAAPIVVEGRLWGAAVVASARPVPLPPDTEARLGDFADLVATAIANTEARAALSLLAEQQAALRRVATLVARGVSPSEMFAAVADEMAGCLHTGNASVTRFNGDGTLSLLALGRVDAEVANMPAIGTRFSLEGDNIAALVLRTGRPARMDSSADASGPMAAQIRAMGFGCTVGAPIIVDERVWGMATLASTAPEPLPTDTEDRIGDFADLIATGIANAATRDELAASRDQLGELAEQQAALRRVATLVARGVDPDALFAAVVDEMLRCIHVDNAAVMRMEPDGAVVIVSGRYELSAGMRSPVGERHSLEGDNIAARVLATGRAARMDNYDNAAGSFAARTRELGIRCRVGVPIVVDGRVWGLAVVSSTKREPLPADTEERLGDFADLVATAIVNAATRDELIASRARIVAAADDARRRIERDLHDGAQQRLVTLGLQSRMAEGSVPPEMPSLKEQLADVVSGLAALSSELQQISRGIHPAILSEGGLGPALKTLARRCPVPVSLDVAVEHRLPDPVEVAAYYVVAEALTNTAKYAYASEVTVRAETKSAKLDLSIQDDGIGGADTRNGSGLIGLKDRVEVLGGHMKITSHPGSGTTLHISIPLTG